MNDWKPVLLLAKRSLWVLFLVALLCVGLVIGLAYFAASLKLELSRLQAGVQDQKTQLEARQSDLLNVRTHIQRYEALRAQGLVGVPDRALWVEQLLTSYRNLDLPGTAAVQLLAAQPLASAAEAAVQADPGTGNTEPMAHDLQFEVRDVLEPEVLGLIKNYQLQVKGRFRVNACKWFEPKDSGFTAQCTLRFVTIAASQAVPAAQ